jgi:hypothetical protein
VRLIILLLTRLWRLPQRENVLMARVSSDHADESMCAERLVGGMQGTQQRPRPFSPQEVKQHNGQQDGFWAVIDGFVVDASEFIDKHPGGLKKLLSADDAAVGASGRPFGFSFSRGRNAHFPETGKRFRDGVQRYMSAAGTSNDAFLPPAHVSFPPLGQVVILGRLED